MERRKTYFRDTPFKEVLKMLSKRFDVDFVVKNPKCFEASFTGVLEKQRLGRNSGIYQRIFKYKI